MLKKYALIFCKNYEDNYGAYFSGEKSSLENTFNEFKKEGYVFLVLAKVYKEYKTNEWEYEWIDGEEKEHDFNLLSMKKRRIRGEKKARRKDAKLSRQTKR